MRGWTRALCFLALAAAATAATRRVSPAKAPAKPRPLKFSVELVRYSRSVAASYSYRFGARNPFAPSNAQSANGAFLPPSAFPTAEYCGHCHAAAYAQWKDSLHRNSFREPFYTKNVALLVSSKGIEYSRHCEGCHNPIALFSGALTPSSKVERSFDDGGLTCSVCHSIVAVQQPTRGNGSYVIGVPAVMTDAAGNRVPGTVPDAEILAHPERHVRAVMQPLYRTPEFCGTCHKSTVPAVLSGYKWLAGFNTYDEWDASAYSHRSPLPFYQKPTAVACQDCHMAPEAAGSGEAAAKHGMIASHRWLGGNTAVPFYFGETEQTAKTEEFLENQRLRVRIFSLSSVSRSSATAPLPADASPLRPGEVVQALVLISNTGLGHSLIPEQRDIYEAWLEFTAATADGTTIWQSGALTPAGQLDPAAHSFTSRLIAPDGTPLLEHQIWLRRAVAFDNTVASGQTALARYEFRVPEGAALPLKLTVRLRYRHFNQHYTDFALGPGHTGYPIVTMAATSASFAATGLAAAPDWKDWNDLGIALLAQANYPEARYALQQGLALHPGYADGLVNLAIADLGLNQFDQARSEAARALTEARAASDQRAAARALYYQGVIERNLDGQLAASAADLQAASRMFPRSRQLLHELGIAEYLLGESAPAQSTFAALLANNPYDLLGHYYLAVLEKRSGQPSDAAAQAAMYEDEKPRAGEAAVALGFLRDHQELQPESVAGHVHMQPGLMPNDQ